MRQIYYYKVWRYTNTKCREKPHHRPERCWLVTGASDAVTADDLLPALVFLIIKADVPNWFVQSVPPLMSHSPPWLCNLYRQSVCYTVKCFSWNCNSIQVSPKIASLNTAGFVELFQDVSRNSFTKSRTASYSYNGAESFMQRRHVFQRPCYTMQSRREISSNKFHEKVSPCNSSITGLVFLYATYIAPFYMRDRQTSSGTFTYDLMSLIRASWANESHWVIRTGLLYPSICNSKFVLKTFHSIHRRFCFYFRLANITFLHNFHFSKCGYSEFQ